MKGLLFDLQSGCLKGEKVASDEFLCSHVQNKFMKATVIKAKIPNSAPFGGMPMVFTDEDVGPKDVDVGPLVVPGDPDGDPDGEPEGLLQRSPSQQLTSQCGMDKSTAPPSAPPNTLCNVLHVRFFAMPHANFIVQFRML